MRAVVQTVSRASVTVGGEVVGEIKDGLLVLVGVTHTDTQATVETMARKVYASFMKFQALVGPWDHVAEGAYQQFVRA